MAVSLRVEPVSILSTARNMYAKRDEPPMEQSRVPALHDDAEAMRSHYLILHHISRRRIHIPRMIIPREVREEYMIR